MHQCRQDFCPPYMFGKWKIFDIGEWNSLKFIIYMTISFITGGNRKRRLCVVFDRSYAPDIPKMQQ